MTEEGELTKEEVFSTIEKIQKEIKTVITGQRGLINRLLIGLFSKISYSFKRGEGERAGGGHILLEGVPGLAKTLAVVAIAHTIRAKFQRIQFTPDLLPADIIGTKVYDTGLESFRTEKGPIFANIILADEINRATPKTQSALLEAMQERQVTIGENSFPLEEPFWVLATQNPIEQEGVYALPEAQTDRFAMKVKVDYPSYEDEVNMLRMRLEHAKVEQIISPRDVIKIRELISRVHIDDKIRDYIVRLARATRNNDQYNLTIVKEMVLYGISPRACQHLMALARTVAFFNGRDYVLPSDVKSIAIDTLRHRIIRSLRAEAENISIEEILEKVLRKISIP